MFEMTIDEVAANLALIGAAKRSLYELYLEALDDLEDVIARILEDTFEEDRVLDVAESLSLAHDAEFDLETIEFERSSLETLRRVVTEADEIVSRHREVLEN